MTWLVGKGTKAAVCEHVRLAWVRFGSLDLLFCAAVVDTFLALPQAQQLGLAVWHAIVTQGCAVMAFK